MSRPIKNDFSFRYAPDVSVNGSKVTYNVGVILRGTATNGKPLVVRIESNIDNVACLMRQCRRALHRIRAEMQAQIQNAETVLSLED
jgi:hypothetical protein